MRDLFGLLRNVGPGGGSPQGRQLDFLATLAAGPAGPRIQVPTWIDGVCKAMNADSNGLPTAENVGQRWRTILERRYPGAHAAKRIAADLERDVRTVQAWLAGQAPYLHVAIEAAWRWNDPLVLFELAGMAPPSDNEIAAQLGEIKGDLEQLGARIARLKGTAS